MDVNKEMRVIEREVDKYHKGLALFQRHRDTVLVHLLRAFEDMCRLSPVFMGFLPSPDRQDMIIHRNLDCLDAAVKWAYECCAEGEGRADLELRGTIYLEAGEALGLGGAYRDVCDSYILWSRGRQEATVDLKSKCVQFRYAATDQSSVEAVDLMLSQGRKAKALESALVAECIATYENNLAEMLSCVVITDKGITYKLPEKIVTAFYAMSLAQVYERAELPDTWKFTHFSLGEFRAFWAGLLAVAQLHSVICFRSGTQGGALESVVMLLTVEDLCEQLSQITQLTRQALQSIVEFITFEPGLKNSDLVMQPLLRLSCGYYAVAPHLIMSSNAERNILTLLNKKDQAAYSRLSYEKEEIMAQRLREWLEQRFPDIMVRTGIKLPRPLPDMDLVLYDKHTRVLFIGEMKWLISTDSIQEVCARDEDLAKGVTQAADILDYALANPQDCMARAYRESLAVSKVYTCVVSKNNIGTSEIKRTVPIVNEDWLMWIVENCQGNLLRVVDAIEGGEFLPVLGKDFEIIKHSTDYAGYTFQYDAIATGPVKHEQNYKGRDRNKPCPCGAVDPVSGRPLKLKKCCG